jgi:L-asparaginase/Glu-tRNA(Gln) amidotransferase subunit D
MLAQVMYMNRVYILYTGGTIGSTGHPLAPMSGPQFIERVLSIPTLAHFRVEHFDDLQYSIDFLDTPLDSADVTASDWLIIARRILSNYASYDGFVILHGTDTMAWAASALSLLVQETRPPIKGVVLGGFGAGNAPLSQAFLDTIANANEQGVTIVGSTQVIRGSTTISTYQTGAGLLLVGSFIACIVVAVLDQKGILLNAPTGLPERIAIIIGWGWIALLALRLLVGH